jgi:hypothetical protein
MALASRELRYACEDKDKDRYDKCSALLVSWKLVIHSLRLIYHLL